MHPEYIVHYSRCQPFQSITSHPPEDWQKTIDSLTESNAWGLARFSDPDYLTRRCEVESLLRERLIAKGGQPKLKHPIYFFLGRHKRWEEHELNVGYSIDLKDLPENAMTFTYGDSLLAFNDDYRTQSGEKYKNSLCKSIFLLSELGLLFANSDYPTFDPLKVEVQLWTMPLEEKVKVMRL